MIPPTLVRENGDGWTTLDLSENQFSCKPVGLSVSNRVKISNVTPPCADRDWLEALYQVAGGRNWTESDNWNSGKPIAQWHGVVTDPDEPAKVIGVFLPENPLVGAMDAVLGVLGEFKSLKYADVSNYNFGFSLEDPDDVLKAKIPGIQYLKMKDEPTVEAVAKLTKDLADLAIRTPKIQANPRVGLMLEAFSGGVGKGLAWFGHVVEVWQFAQLYSVVHSLDLNDLDGTFDTVYRFLNVPENVRYYPLEQALKESCKLEHGYDLGKTDEQKIFYMVCAVRARRDP